MKTSFSDNDTRENALIFDLDGTLWNSSQEVVTAWNTALARHKDLQKQITVSDMQSYMGKQMEAIMELILPDCEEDRRLELLDECCREEHAYLREHGAPLYPDIIETLTELKKQYQLYIVSNCQDGYIQTFLDYYKLWDLFDDFENPGRTNLDKAGNISLVIERNKVKKACYIGDTLGDQQASDKAGIPFIHAAYGFGKPDRKCPEINSMKELPEVIKAIFCE